MADEYLGVVHDAGAMSPSIADDIRTQKTVDVSPVQNAVADVQDALSKVLVGQENLVEMLMEKAVNADDASTNKHIRNWLIVCVHLVL